jgi:hypothetical protein
MPFKLKKEYYILIFQYQKYINNQTVAKIYKHFE